MGFFASFTSEARVYISHQPDICIYIAPTTHYIYIYTVFISTMDNYRVLRYIGIPVLTYIEGGIEYTLYVGAFC